MNLPVYIVNLPQSAERREAMRRLCSRHGLNPIFTEAVYGKALRPEELSAAADSAAAQQSIGRTLMAGEIGCALSHLNIYRDIIANHHTHALILEDDVLFDSGFVQLVQHSLHALSQRTWDTALLGHHSGQHGAHFKPTPVSFWGRQRIDSTHTLARPTAFGFGTYAYLVSQHGARTLLQLAQPLHAPIDHYTGDIRRLHVYALCPPPVRIDPATLSLIDSRDSRAQQHDKPLIAWCKRLRVYHLLRSVYRLCQALKPLPKPTRPL